MHALKTASLVLLLSGCGVGYNSPAVRDVSSADSKVRVMPITGETVLIANSSAYQPQGLPSVFFATAGSGGTLRGTGALPDPASLPEARPASMETRLPPTPPRSPYKIGVGDVVILATPQSGSTVAELSGLLAAQNRRQGYTVQDDGAIAIPEVGRVQIADMTLEEAEAALFTKLVENQIDPAFSLEIAEFNAHKVAIGGAVKSPTVVPITLTPLTLDAALAAAGGVATTANRDYTTIRIYRDGAIYQIPLKDLYTRANLQKVPLAEGDSIFVDTEFDLAQAESYFAEQIQLASFRNSSRQQALSELQTAVSLRRADMAEARANFQSRIDLDSVDRDYVYLTGEVGKQGRYPLPFDHKAVLADAIWGQGSGLPTTTANVAQIYVLRGSTDPREFGATTAWQLDARNAANLILATRFELRPNDVVFVAEQPVTRWSRVVTQITPSLIGLGVNSVSGN